MAIPNWFFSVLERRGGKPCDLRNRITASTRDAAQRWPAGPRVAAKLAIVLADGRPAVLLVPSSRCVVPDRVGKLLGADVVHLVSENKIQGILAEIRATGSGSSSGEDFISVLMDASLLSAQILELRAGALDAPISLPFEDCMSLVNPGPGFFTKPDDSPSRNLA